MADESAPPDGVEVIESDSGRVAARHLDSGVSGYGDDEEDAVRQLADALNEVKGGGCPELWEYMSEFRDEE